MRRLDYLRYVAQGGDVGAIVTDAMGRQAPQGLLQFAAGTSPDICWLRS